MDPEHHCDCPHRAALSMQGLQGVTNSCRICSHYVGVVLGSVEDRIINPVRNLGTCATIVRALIDAHRFHEGVDLGGPSTVMKIATDEAWKLLVGILCVLRKGKAELFKIGLTGIAMTTISSISVKLRCPV